MPTPNLLMSNFDEIIHHYPSPCGVQYSDIHGSSISSDRTWWDSFQELLKQERVETLQHLENLKTSNNQLANDIYSSYSWELYDQIILQGRISLEDILFRTVKLLFSNVSLKEWQIMLYDHLYQCDTLSTLPLVLFSAQLMLVKDRSSSTLHKTLCIIISTIKRCSHDGQQLKMTEMCACFAVSTISRHIDWLPSLSSKTLPLASHCLDSSHHSIWMGFICALITAVDATTCSTEGDINSGSITPSNSFLLDYASYSEEFCPFVVLAPIAYVGLWLMEFDLLHVTRLLHSHRFYLSRDVGLRADYLAPWTSLVTLMPTIIPSADSDGVEFLQSAHQLGGTTALPWNVAAIATIATYGLIESKWTSQRQPWSWEFREEVLFHCVLLLISRGSDSERSHGNPSAKLAMTALTTIEGWKSLTALKGAFEVGCLPPKRWPQDIPLGVDAAESRDTYGLVQAIIAAMTSPHVTLARRTALYNTLRNVTTFSVAQACSQVVLLHCLLEDIPPVMRGAVFDILRSCTAFASNDHIPSETPMKVDQDTLRSVLGDLDCKDKKLRYRKITADGWLIRSKLIEYSHLLSDRTEGKGGHRILLTSNWAFQLLYLPYLEECAAIHPSEVSSHLDYVIALLCAIYFLCTVLTSDSGTNSDSNCCWSWHLHLCNSLQTAADCWINAATLVDRLREVLLAASQLDEEKNMQITLALMRLEDAAEKLNLVRSQFVRTVEFQLQGVV